MSFSRVTPYHGRLLLYYYIRVSQRRLNDFSTSLHAREERFDIFCARCFRLTFAKSK